MKNKNLVLAFLIISLSLICIIGCSDDDNDLYVDFTYPLAIGNNWKYENIFELSLRTHNSSFNMAYRSSGSVEIIGEEVIFDTLEVFNFKSVLNEGDNIYTGNGYYNHKDSALFRYGYTQPQIMTPKVDQKYAYLMFKNKKFNNVREIINWIEKGSYVSEYSKEDSIIFDPVKSLDYPLEAGKQWIYRTETYNGQPYRIDKKVLEWDKITVPAGEFICCQIQWLINPFGSTPDWDEDIVFLDVISEKGLVRRIIDFRNIEVYDAEDNLTAHLRVRYQQILTEYTIEM